MMQITHQKDGSMLINGYVIPEGEDCVGRNLIEENMEKFKAAFVVAGFEVKNMWQVSNQYWPAVWNYAYLRESNPWWLVETEFGNILIGPRKRVFNINWSHCDYRGIVTEDDVTKGKDMVHAWSYEDVVKYLMALYKKMNEK